MKDKDLLDDDCATFGVRGTPEQWREIHRRSGLRPFDGLARGQYLIGCALGEPHDELVARVHRIAEERRAILLAEIQAECVERERAKRERVTKRKARFVRA